MPFSIDMLAIGKAKDAYELDAFLRYKRRLPWNITLHELPSAKTAKQEAEFYLKRLDPASFFVALDERGKGLSSLQFSDMLKRQMLDARRVSFIIGGADGLDKALVRRADCVLSFGNMTWPHMLVRVMLIEQIYRAYSLMHGHPYHRSG